jgi:hypothetical protein
MVADGEQREDFWKLMQQFEELARIEVNAHSRGIGHAVNSGINPFATAVDEAVSAHVAGRDMKITGRVHTGSLSKAAFSIVMKV